MKPKSKEFKDLASDVSENKLSSDKELQKQLLPALAMPNDPSVRVRLMSTFLYFLT